MNLRPELTPPPLDPDLIARLAELADRLDGDPDEDLRAEFNRLAGTRVPMAEFQGISGGEDCDEYVRRVVYRTRIQAVPGVTRDELIEVVRRAMSSPDYLLRDAYRIIFEANVARPGASNLIFYPPDYDSSTNTWGGGRAIADYAPTPEEIVGWTIGQDTSAERGRTDS